MPDWSYHAVFPPLLFRLPAEAARGMVLRALRIVGTHAGGPDLIDFLWHLRPPAQFRCSARGLAFTTPIAAIIWR